MPGEDPLATGVRPKGEECGEALKVAGAQIAYALRQGTDDNGNWRMSDGLAAAQSKYYLLTLELATSPTPGAHFNKPKLYSVIPRMVLRSRPAVSTYGPRQKWTGVVGNARIGSLRRDL